MAKLLNKKDILEADDLSDSYVDVPQWGGTVRIMAMDGELRDKFESSMVQIKNFGTKKQKVEYNQVNQRARLVAYSVVDEEGNRIFNESDIIKLGKKSSKALDKVFAEAQKLNGITDEDLEEMTKN